MLSELQNNKYTKRAQKETKKLLNKLNIVKLTNILFVIYKKNLIY